MTVSSSRLSGGPHYGESGPDLVEVGRKMAAAGQNLAEFGQCEANFGRIRAAFDRLAGTSADCGIVLSEQGLSQGGLPRGVRAAHCMCHNVVRYIPCMSPGWLWSDLQSSPCRALGTERVVLACRLAIDRFDTRVSGSAISSPGRGSMRPGAVTTPQQDRCGGQSSDFGQDNRVVPKRVPTQRDPPPTPYTHTPRRCCAETRALCVCALRDHFLTRLCGRRPSSRPLLKLRTQRSAASCAVRVRARCEAGRANFLQRIQQGASHRPVRDRRPRAEAAPARMSVGQALSSGDLTSCLPWMGHIPAPPIGRDSPGCRRGTKG